MTWDTTALLAKARMDNHPAVAAPPTLRLTPAIFGKLLVAAWAARHGRTDFPPRDRITDVLLERAGEAPADVDSILCVDDRITGPVLADWSEYMAAAQMSGLVKRLNPDYVRVVVEIDGLTGRDLLDDYTRGKPELKRWVETVVDDLSRPAGMASCDAASSGR
ncbi:hypothetical protein HL658_29655 [Azospirillum sp. RWY-5-1]|uniref:Uncharacterized protein n=1 Tax=Azospirillum oleiclasticum TaxID=2735135 RepID=A0ABX2THY4_9PROT|nr:hypothetical protein [Azospirillum oleiclasticum]NYZ16733.1 hypothetical protein [Azospirillum oleiclasticum]NYZ23365.1 hypothetical protein [Azospirillum oleiclasticum]